MNAYASKLVTGQGRFYIFMDPGFNGSFSRRGTSNLNRGMQGGFNEDPEKKTKGNS